MNKKLIIGLVLVVIVAAAVYFFYSPEEQPTEEQPLKTDIIAYVNGDVITQSDLNIIYASTELEFRDYATPDYILNQSIERVLLSQEAEKRGFSISNAELEDYLKGHYAKLSTTEEEFEKNLEMQKLSYDSYKESVRKQLLINDLIEKNLSREVNVSQSDVEKRFTALYNGTNATLEQTHEELLTYLLWHRTNEILRVNLDRLLKEAVIEFI
ncbi:MAG: hypothetical protein GY861_28470 [bacterium]|nr:hypothetical protein [bacterium]